MNIWVSIAGVHPYHTHLDHIQNYYPRYHYVWPFQILLRFGAKIPRNLWHSTMPAVVFFRLFFSAGLPIIELTCTANRYRFYVALSFNVLIFLLERLFELYRIGSYVWKYTPSYLHFSLFDIGIQFTFISQVSEWCSWIGFGQWSLKYIY